MDIENKLTEAPIQIPIVDKDGNLVNGWQQQISQLFDAVIELQNIIEENL